MPEKGRAYSAQRVVYRFTRPLQAGLVLGAGLQPSSFSLRLSASALKNKRGESETDGKRVPQTLIPKN